MFESRGGIKLTVKYVDETGPVIPPIRPYSQAAEPTLERVGDLGLWMDSDDSDTPYLAFKRGAGDQVKVEIGAAPLCYTDQSTLNATSIKMAIASGGTPAVDIDWGDSTTTPAICDGAWHTYIHNYGATGQYGINLFGSLENVKYLSIINQAWIYGDLGDMVDKLDPAFSYMMIYNTGMTGDISALSKFPDMTRFHASGTMISGNVSVFSGLTKLVNLNTPMHAGIVGDIGSFAGCTVLKQFLAENAAMSGNLSSLSGLTTLTHLYLKNSSVEGDIANLSGNTNMVRLRMQSPQGGSVYGDIASLAGMSVLNQLYLQYTDVSGDIASLSGLTNMAYLYLFETQVTGDIGALKTMTNLLRYYMFDNVGQNLVYNATTLPAWSLNFIYLQNLGLSSAEVNNFLIDLAAAGGTNGELRLDGANAYRTSASDAAIVTLLANDWTLYVNG